ncbi:hypothetical protein NDU88_008292 [Pleurodeles waltl]|uniref:Uncharacterized protein n=1 Tax=Pleurodeles waltl TaxID=8319 RepID=A0AAV7VS41_PLEWA|nr:hypothetical protein NDU88_008292 [Pleurodeles waltl]
MHCGAPTLSHSFLTPFPLKLILVRTTGVSGRLPPREQREGLDPRNAKAGAPSLKLPGSRTGARRREEGILTLAFLSIKPSPRGAGGTKQLRSDGEKLPQLSRAETEGRSAHNPIRAMFGVTSVRREFTGSALADRHVPPPTDHQKPEILLMFVPFMSTDKDVFLLV